MVGLGPTDFPFGVDVVKEHTTYTEIEADDPFKAETTVVPARFPLAVWNCESGERVMQLAARGRCRHATFRNQELLAIETNGSFQVATVRLTTWNMADGKVIQRPQQQTLSRLRVNTGDIRPSPTPSQQITPLAMIMSGPKDADDSKQAVDSAASRQPKMSALRLTRSRRRGRRSPSQAPPPEKHAQGWASEGGKLRSSSELAERMSDHKRWQTPNVLAG